MITTTNPEEQKIIDRVVKAGQEHVFRFWPELNQEARKKMLTQLNEIDYDLLVELNQAFIQATNGHFVPGKLEPAEFITIPETAEEKASFKTARAVGEKALREGRVAAFLVAGGQGSRLGYDGPKGILPISPIKEKSIFQLHADKIKARSKKYQSTIPWYIMTSETNQQQTIDFFEANKYFGLPGRDVKFFRQEMVPALDSNGKLFLDAKDHIFTNPNGHGGALSALKKSGALDDMSKRSIDFIFYFQVDNVLVKICDPVFLGFHIQKQAQMSAKIVAKTDPHEKVGVIGKMDGKLQVIEYSDFSDREKEARDSDGNLKYRAGSIAIHIFNVDFVEKENQGGLRLPWHMAHKKIWHLDQAGRLIEPDNPNGYKFETFVFDALIDTTSSAILEVRRNEEFSPVKNAIGVNSPKTAKLDMVNLFGKWLEKAGVQVPRDAQNNVVGNIEISPLFAMDEDELVTKVNSDLKFDNSLYLE